MSSVPKEDDLMAEYRKLLGVQIKLDIAAAIRKHPHLEGPDSQKVYEQLASDQMIQNLVQELAHEEVEDSIARGHVPPAAMLALAGFKPNPGRTS
ncbi:MAG: hypothetical protein HY903_13035 [Deltaproteobacteria bacterium]|nr:hypothetical protein [Deltaproteobacteria bacterium]